MQKLARSRLEPACLAEQELEQPGPGGISRPRTGVCQRDYT